MEKIDFLPHLQERSFILKLLVLLLLIAVGTLLTMVIGIVVALPFFGTDVLTHFNRLTDLSNQGSINFMKYFQVVNQLGVFVLPALAFAYLATRKVSSYLKLKAQFSFPVLLISVMLIIISIPVINRLVEINEQMKLPDALWRIENWMQNTEDQTKVLTDAFLNVNTIGGLLVNLFVIAFLAAIGEEFLFRGILLRIFDEWFHNIHFAVLISAVLFSAMHMQFYGFLPRAVLGIILGYIFVWSGNLWIPIILHCIFNSISVIAAYLYDKGMITTDVDTLGTNMDNTIVFGSLLLSLVLMFIIYKMRARSGT